MTVTTENIQTAARECGIALPDLPAELVATGQIRRTFTPLDVPAPHVHSPQGGASTQYAADGGTHPTPCPGRTTAFTRPPAVDRFLRDPAAAAVGRRPCHPRSRPQIRTLLRAVLRGPIDPRRAGKGGLA